MRKNDSAFKEGRRKQRRRNTTRTCRGKVRYRDQAEARQALQRIQTGDARSTSPVRVYLCDGRDGCGGWHLTSRAER